jgi:hypothetical protein
VSEPIFRCSKCDAYWPPEKTECVFCHGTERIVSGTMLPISRPPAPYRPWVASEPDVSETGWVVYTVIVGLVIGIIAFASLKGNVDNAWVYSGMAGLTAAGNVWIVAMIRTIKLRVDRVGRMLESIERKLTP